ncbi:peptidoglycan DD-metalloendopeptidase family protein [Dactylosporangium sp. NPDC048998]|uniref:peptidoglycan DD-metalloendopeptidase family protein n=1 Tax=Dactylosporangium sp. NPDC048998 TaxID=3363976 RepID=UPI00371DC121
MKWTAIITAVVLVVCGCCGLVVFLGVTQASACAPTLTGGVTVHTDGLHDVGPWRVDPQVRNAAIIVGTGQQLNVPARGWVIAVATAMQESSLTNTPGGDRDSVGLFQQRPSQGWGTPEQLRDPAYAATAFYRKLLTVKGWEQLPLTEAAQAVQRSAYPNAYAKYEQDAERVVAEVTGAATIDELPGASLANCDGSAAPGTPSASGWVQPVPGKIVSPYGPRGEGKDRKLHAGDDLEAKRNDVIVAAAAGTVSYADCDRHTGNCDIDGSPSTPGCGWYVDINNGSGIATRYCHMVRRPDVHVGQQVQAGQRIGLVGTSGHSSGPHLHFEVHEGVDCPSGQRCQLANANSRDPAPFMAAHGAPLGGTR